MPDRPKRILIVDDNASMVELLQMALPEYETEAVPDGGAALVRAREFAPDLIIMDQLLPDTRGTALARQLRDVEQFRETPMILISGLVEQSPGGEPVQVEGMAAFGKPFKFDVLRKYVELHLAGPESTRAALAGLTPVRLDD